jgi:hypothetical protein
MRLRILFAVAALAIASACSQRGAPAAARGTMCAAEAMPNDLALSTWTDQDWVVNPTACEMRALKATFCATVAGRPDHDTMGIATVWIAAFRTATADGHTRSAFLTQGYYDALVDGRAAPDCGFPVAGLK